MFRPSCRPAVLGRVPGAIAFGLIVTLLALGSTALPLSRAADLPRDAIADVSTLSPDLRAAMATRRLTEVKRQIAEALSGACPSSAAAWDGWLDGIVSLAATLIAVGDMDGPLKRSGASLEQLRAFNRAKGSSVVQFETADAAKRKIDECAASLGLTPPSMQELVDRVYARADVQKQREEAAIGLVQMYRPIKRH